MESKTFFGVVRANMPYDKGNMFMNGIDEFITPYYDLAAYNNDRVNYIRYNEEGTIYTKKNKGFISKKTVGMVNRIMWSENLGLPYDFSEIDETLAVRNNDILTKQGVIDNVSTTNVE